MKALVSKRRKVFWNTHQRKTRAQKHRVGHVLYFGILENIRNIRECLKVLIRIVTKAYFLLECVYFDHTEYNWHFICTLYFNFLNEENDELSFTIFRYHFFCAEILANELRIKYQFVFKVNKNWHTILVMMMLTFVLELSGHSIVATTNAFILCKRGTQIHTQEKKAQSGWQKHALLQFTSQDINSKIKNKNNWKIKRDNKIDKQDNLIEEGHVRRGRKTYSNGNKIGTFVNYWYCKTHYKNFAFSSYLS